MASINEMVGARLPDEAELFATSLDTLIEEATALEGWEGMAEADLSTLQKSLIADLTAQALILPAMSHYKKAIAEAQGDGAGTARFADKLQFLNHMEIKLTESINDKRGRLDAAADTGVPLAMVVER